MKEEAHPTQVKAVFNNRVDVKFGRPVKKTQLRVIGIDDAIVLEEVTRTVAQFGDCKET